MLQRAERVSIATIWRRWSRSLPLTITNEAQYRMLQVANTLRSANPAVLIYSVGLGGVTNPVFLKELANTS